MKDLFELALEHAADSGTTVGLTWHQVLELHKAAKRDRALKNWPDGLEQGPADGSVDLENAGAQSPGGLPVPKEPGDRQPRNIAGNGVWPDVDNLAEHLAAGRTHDVATILRYAGGVAPYEETATAIVSCRARNLHDAVTSLLRYAAVRTEHDVLNILKILLDGQHEDLARRLLEFHPSCTDSGSAG